MDLNNKELRENIAENLKALRECYDLKQKPVAQALGIDPATYRNWESGRSVPNISTLYEIAKMYKISINRLCGVEVNEDYSLSLASPNEFNKNIYAESKITDLEISERQMIMQIRRLTNNDKQKVAKCITELLNKANSDSDN